jgi:glycosyltransferase involved in cell wall biosynthesis
MKFAFISQILPPASSGQAVVIQRLLQDLNPDSYCLISQQEQSHARNNYSGRLAGHYYQLPTEFRALKKDHSHLSKLKRRLYLLLSTVLGLGIISRAYRIAKILKREKCRAVIACTSAELLDLPAGYLASRLAHASFYAYIFDDYSYVWPQMRWWARRMERFLLKRAGGIIVPNEFMGQELYRRHKVRALVIHNPVDTSKYQIAPDAARSQPTPEIKIVYTGAVYGAHYDAFMNLLKAIGLLKRADVKLHIYTTYPLDELKENGVEGALVRHEHETVSAMPDIQQQSDMLFLPLAFSSPFPEIIRTSAPGKIGEYLAAGRPILVHAPKDSFVSWYFRAHECGLVVDESDPAILAEAIERLLSDVELAERLSRNAKRQAEADFSISIARQRFAGLMKLSEGAI